MTRAYDMTQRAAAADQTRELIATSTEQLLADGPLAEVTLQAIAQGAGVTVQTVLRHMGSRDGCIEAAGARVAERIAGQRGQVTPGDVDAAIAELTAHYESEGKLVLNLLSQETDESPQAQEAARAGRKFHRRWVEVQFAPLLTNPDREIIDALVAATDLYVWKLIRLDLGRSAAKTEAVINRLVRSTLENS